MDIALKSKEFINALITPYTGLASLSTCSFIDNCKMGGKFFYSPLIVQGNIYDSTLHAYYNFENTVTKWQK